MCDVIGKPGRVLTHGNRGQRTHYSDYSDQPVRQMLLRHFGRDVELFGLEDQSRSAKSASVRFAIGGQV